MTIFDADKLIAWQREKDKPEPPKQLTVAALIELLQKCDPNALVESDGCDCVGAATGVVIRDDGKVLIRR